MKKTRAIKNFYYCAIVLIILSLSCCQSNLTQLTASESAAVTDSVKQLAANISRDVSTKGPIAWLTYFENAPGFFMASNGQLAFKDYPAAKTFILNTLVKSITSITLNWKNTRIDPLTQNFATFGADFHEDLVLANGGKLAVDGYLTATAHFNGNSWKLRNLNWAIKPPTSH